MKNQIIWRIKSGFYTRTGSKINAKLIYRKCASVSLLFFFYLSVTLFDPKTSVIIFNENNSFWQDIFHSN